MQPQTSTPAPPGFIRRNLVAVLGVGTIACVGLAWLAFGYFGIHTAFIDNKVDEDGPVFASGATAAGATAAEPAAAEPATAEPAAAEPAGEGTDDITTVASATFTSLGRYSASGDALVLNDGSEQRFLRFENFEVSNGPDLNVYLAVGGDVDAGFVDLGDLKGNIGDQNYEIPVDVDLSEFDTVLVWCVRFGVGFAEAPLA